MRTRISPVRLSVDDGHPLLDIAFIEAPLAAGGMTCVIDEDVDVLEFIRQSAAQRRYRIGIRNVQ